MKASTIMIFACAAIVVGLLLYLLRNLFLKAKGTNKAQAEEVTPTNLIGKEKIKLMPYKEALQASKQFIYNVAKLVMERFSPTAKATLMELGRSWLILACSIFM